MKTIVIPSDFSADSIQVAELMVRNTNEDLHLIFTHLFHVADDIQDLLFSNYRKKEYEFVPESFWDECKVMKNIYGNVRSIKIEFFYGSKLAVFKNFLEFNDADCIAYSESYGIPKISKSSIDALQVIRKCGLPLLDVDRIKESVFSESGHVL